MVRWLIFFLSCGQFIIGGCQAQSNPDRYDYLSKEERDSYATIFNANYPAYYQGSVYKKIKFDSLQLIAPWEEYNYREQSVAWTKIGDYHLAIPLLEKAAKLNPEESLYYYSWLLVYYYRDYERALHYLNEFDNFYPGQMQYAWGENVNYLKGLAYKGLGDFDHAVAEFDTAIRQEGRSRTDVYTYVYRGICELKRRNFEQALNDFNSCLEYYDRSAMAYTYRAVAQYKLGKANLAIADIKKANELIQQGYKKEDPYVHVFNEVNAFLLDDLASAIQKGEPVLNLLE